MKPVIALPIEHYESILKRATEDSPLYFRLKNAVKMANTVVVRYDPEHAEMLLQAAKALLSRRCTRDSTSDQGFFPRRSRFFDLVQKTDG